MKTSETITKLIHALLLAQKNITFAAKESNNPFFKSKYADLPTVIDAVKPALNENGIVFIQTASPSESGTVSLTTRLIHTSGEWIEDTATAALVKNDPQGYGSAITYLRRYSLAAITGLYQDDDDGNAASHQQKVTPEFLSVEQINTIADLADSKGMTVDEICTVAKVKTLNEINKTRYDGLVSWIKKQPSKGE
jgi:hypothetical protein